MSERERDEPLSHGGPDEVTQLLGELKDVDPPAELVGTVMSRISSAAPARVRRLEPVQFSGGKRMAKKVLWSVMGAAAAVLIVMKIAGYPPKSGGTEGTIGAAQRYQSQQIADGDVKTTDADLQKFLQSDAFHTLASDKAARQALANKDVQKALADPAILAALADPQVREALNNEQFLFALKSDQVRAVLADEQLRLKLADEQLRLKVNSAEIHAALQNEQLLNALKSPEVVSALELKSFTAMMSSPALIGLLSAPNAAEVISSPALIGMLSAPGFALAVQAPEFSAALEAAAVR